MTITHKALIAPGLQVNVLQPSPRQDQRGSWTSHLPEIGKKPSSPLSPCMTAAANISAAILNRLKSDHPSANGDSFGAVRIGMYGLEDLVLQTLKVNSRTLLATASYYN